MGMCVTYIFACLHAEDNNYLNLIQNSETKFPCKEKQYHLAEFAIIYSNNRQVGL